MSVSSAALDTIANALCRRLFRYPLAGVYTLHLALIRCALSPGVTPKNLARCSRPERGFSLF
jgi:hypothetical protein